LGNPASHPTHAQDRKVGATPARHAQGRRLAGTWLGVENPSRRSCMWISSACRNPASGQSRSAELHLAGTHWPGSSTRLAPLSPDPREEGDPDASMERQTSARARPHRARPRGLQRRGGYPGGLGLLPIAALRLHRPISVLDGDADHDTLGRFGVARGCRARCRHAHRSGSAYVCVWHADVRHARRLRRPARRHRLDGPRLPRETRILDEDHSRWSAGPPRCQALL
jgi:hypothetical protein